MWESIRKSPLGRLSVRKSLHFATALLAVCFVYIFTTSSTAFAVDSTWSGDDITYNGNIYTGPTTSAGTESHNIPKDSTLYTYIEPALGMQKAHVIYFAPGSDPGDMTSAKYQTFDYPSANTYQNPSGASTISIDKKSSATGGTAAGETTSCALEGIGWLICPFTKAIAKGMDYVFSLITGYLEVRPLGTNTDNPMYRVWSIMRNLANIAFILAFLIVIYSQLVGGGLTNYSVKRILPRIVVAAVLVNTSYWICALAIDIFNIMGYSLDSMFKGMRDSLVGPGGNNWKLFSWESVFGFILSGGAVAAAGAIGATLAVTSMAGVSVAGIIMLLLPIALGLLLVILVTFLVLAARQAILTVLVIVAPLAFVAYLLPNTEKWFDKWRSLFLTLLIVFPAFSIVFGASQLAGALIIQNAKEINMVILGMAVQVAPLAITPLLLKLGGGLLNRFAGIVNNPGKGLVDRSRTFSKDRLSGIRARNMAQNREMQENGTLRRRNVARRYALREENNRFDREGTKSANEALSKGLYSQRSQAQSIHARLERAKLEQSVGDAAGQSLWEQQAATTPLLRQKRMQQHNDTQFGEGYKKSWEAEVAEMDAGNNPYVAGTVMARLADNARDNAREIAVQSMRVQSAQNMQKADIANALQADLALRVQAGGIDPNGVTNAGARASAIITALNSEAIKNIKDSSPIVPGDTATLRTELTSAMRAGNDIAMRAYTDMIAEAGDPGVATLREVIKEVDSGAIPLSADMKTTLKFQLNGNGALNAAAKDIGSWSRDAANTKTIDGIINNAETWSKMSASEWSALKESTQQEALGFTLVNPANPTGPRVRTRASAIDQVRARAIKNGPAFQNLKAEVQAEIERIAL